MDNHHKPPNRSDPTPFLQESRQSRERAELQAWERSVEAAHRAVRNGMYASGYHGFGNGNTTAGVLTPAYGRFADTGLEFGNDADVSGGGGLGEVDSPESDTTVKQGQSHYDGDGSALTPTSSRNIGQAVQMDSERRGRIPIALHVSLTSASDPFRRPTHTDSRVQQSVPSSLRSSGPLANADPYGSPQGLQGLQSLQGQGMTTLHQRRMASTLSPLASQPVVQFNSHKAPVPKRLILGDQDTQNRPPAFQNHFRGEEKKRDYEVDVNRRGGDLAGGTMTQSPRFLSNVAVHGRQPTDPFIDYMPNASPRVVQPSTQYLHPRQSSVHVPRTSPTGGLPTPYSAFGPSLTPTQTFAPIPSNRAPDTLTWPASAPAGSTPHVSAHRSLPIPPSPLSSRQGHTRSPQADLQESLRWDWIRTEAAKIAQISRLRYQAEHHYLRSRTEEDYELWQQAEAAFADATSLEKRQEERRGLFLKEKGMVPLKTGREEDMSAAMRGQPDAMGEREDKLLGFTMALMERICAEVKPKEGDEEIITADMLATLSLEERKALRAHLVTRLEKT